MSDSKVRDCSAWTHHAFLDEELGSFQGPCHVLAKSLSLLLIQDLSVEGANLQKKQVYSPEEKGTNQKQILTQSLTGFPSS